MQIIPLPSETLATKGAKRRPDHINLVVLMRTHQQVRIHVPAVKQMDAWEQITIG